MTTVKYKIHHPKTQDCEKGLLIGSENTNAGHRHHQYVKTKPFSQTTDAHYIIWLKPTLNT